MAQFVNTSIYLQNREPTAICFCAGQVARYMYHAKVRYAFLSTYEFTVFFKQAPYPSIPGRNVLWYSRLIRHDTRAQNPVGDASQVSFYWGKASLREAFLFLGLEIKANNWRFDNSMLRSDWYRIGKMPRVDDESDYIDG